MQHLSVVLYILHLPRGAVAEVSDMSVEIARRTRACWMRIRRCLRELYDQPKDALSLKTRMVKVEAIEALLYGCSTWTLGQEHDAKLRTVHHRVLLRIIGAQRKRPDHQMTSYNRALEITLCESIETTLRTRRLLWAGTLLRMSDRRLPKRIVFGNLEGVVRRGQCGKENKWTNCVQSDIRAFGIARDWKATALKAEVRVEMVTEGGRSVEMAPNQVMGEIVLDGGGHFIPAGIFGLHTLSLLLAPRAAHGRTTEDTRTHTGNEHQIL